MKKREDSLELLRKLIPFKNEVGNPYEEIQRFIAEKLSEVCAEIDIWDPYLETLKQSRWVTTSLEYYPEGFKGKPIVVGCLSGTGGGWSLIFNGHFEVVTPGHLELWTTDPWVGSIRDGKMFGRGVSDCKGGLAAAIHAIETISEAGIKLKGDFFGWSVYDEEIGGTGTLAAILQG